MLKHLYIRNYALIKEQNIDFGNGFSVITGETGAGKSILLGAINLLLGQRVDTKALQDSNEKCIIEACFQLDKYNLKPLFEAQDIEYDDECIIRREISPSGKSRAFINDTPVQLNTLKEIGTRLIDIHSQHQNLLINKAAFLIGFIDTIAGNQNKIATYKTAYTEYLNAQKELNDFIARSNKNKDEEEYLRFQLSLISNAKIKEDEQEELEDECNVLSHAEEIKNSLFSINELFDSDNGGVLSFLKKQINTASSLKNIYPQIDDIAKRLESAYIDLKDLSYDVASKAEDINFDPERLEYVNERLNTIYTLQQRFHVSNNKALLDIADDISKKIESIESYDEKIEELNEKVKTTRDNAAEIADEISQSRKGKFNYITEGIKKILANLGMPDVSIVFECSEKENLSPDGKDNITMTFSANKNRALQDISSIASGGEIARVMLAIKYMTCKVKTLPTIFFDEIDTGVSGDIAARMGTIMQDMGKNMQVISITHLPQIAAKGNRQYKVYKNNENDTTTSNIRLLDNEERIKEIALMLSGNSITDAAINNAKELLNND